MDLLIELINWILKQFFGETEKTADMDDAARRRGARPKQVRAPGNAPSLEELLAEVRREAEQKRRMQAGGAPEIRPAPRPQPAKPQRQAAPPETAPVPAARGNVLETREIKSMLEVAPIPEPIRPPENVTAPEIVATPDTVAPLYRGDAVAEAPAAPRKRKQKAVAIGKPTEVVSLKAPVNPAIAETIRAIRQGTGPERRQIAQQAFVLNEIFGPCRARRRHAPR